MTLALLLTAVGGAWAEESESITTTLPEEKTGSVEFTGTHFKITGQRADTDGMNLGSSTKRTITISALNGEIITKVEMTIGFKFYSWQWEVLSTKGNVSGTYTTGYNLTLTDVDVSEVTLSASNTTTGYLQFNKFKIFYTMPAGTMTLNTDNTVATMTMPAYDATVNYELVRDMAVDVNSTIADRIRIAKMEAMGGLYAPVNSEEILPVVTDDLDEPSVTMQKDIDYELTLQKQGDGADQWTDVTSSPLYSVGTFRYKITGKGNYSGEIYTNVFQLYEGYELTVAPGEYATYYRTDEALYVEDTDVTLYTITAVSGDKATATEVTTAPAGLPLLVKNNAAEAKTILLIPTTTATADDVTPYEGFKGTLEATQIAASTATQNNYALNGKQFVFVKNAIEVGPNKAWLSVNTGVPSARITLVFEDETTGISLTPNPSPEGEGSVYDLNGRKLDKMPTKKGVYIMNGKKVVVK